MRLSKTLQKLRAGRTARVCSLGHYIPHFLRHAAQYNYDCVWLDLEHRGLEHREVQALLAYSHLADIDVMVRPRTTEKAGLYRYLEDGATGLMIPHVSSAEKARQLVSDVRFPPLGDRGLDGAGFDSDFSYDGAAYPVLANRETFLVVQIESPQAVQNVGNIAASGVDAIFIGTGDLGLRLRHTPDAPDLETAIEQVAQACAGHDLPWGCPVGSPEDLRKRESQGATLLAYGGEFRAIVAMFESASRAFDAGDAQIESEPLDQ